MLFQLLINIIAGVIIGILLHRSDYCMTGMFRDLFLFRKTFMLRILYIQIIVTMLLFIAGRYSGLITLYPPPNLRLPSLNTLYGGIIFGTGMVLSGGCVVGTLYKMSSGNGGSILAFIGLILGSAIYGEFYPFFQKINYFFGDYVLLGEKTGDTIPLIIMFTGIIPLIIWIKKGMLTQKAYAHGYIHPWKTAIILSFINLILYELFYMPLAISTGFAKIGGFIESWLMPEHFEKLTFFKKDSFRLIHNSELIQGGPGPHLDHIFTTEVGIMAGIIAGSFISAMSLKDKCDNRAGKEGQRDNKGTP